MSARRESTLRGHPPRSRTQSLTLTPCSDANALAESQARHALEAKGLLVIIKYLKLRVTREATFRGDMAFQKTYLGVIVQEKQAT